MGKYLPILKIAQCGSFNKAAGELGYSQPNLWYIVNNLEDDLGIRLFHRSRQGATLTDAGKTLLERMARIEAQENSLYQFARTYHQNQVRVGLCPGLSGPWVAELLASLKTAHPTIHVKLEQPGTCRDGLDAVAEEGLDLCFSVLSGAPEVDALPLWEEPYELVVGADHPLARLEQASLRDVLGSYPLIPTAESFDPDGPLWELFRRTEHVLLADSTPPDPQLSMALVERGLGVTLLPGMALTKGVEQEGLRRIPLTDGPTRSVTLLCGKEGVRSPLAEEMVRFVLSFFRERDRSLAG